MPHAIWKIAGAPNKAARQRLIEALAKTNSGLKVEFEAAKHLAKSQSSCARHSGRFPFTAIEDVNTYALFCRTGPPASSKWDDDRRALLRAELDAYYARLYGLTRDELRYIAPVITGGDLARQVYRLVRRFAHQRTGCHLFYGRTVCS